jgi:hypothetical protein
MAATPYKIVTIDLGTVADSKQIPGTLGADVAFIGVISRPAGSALYLKLGSGADSIPLSDNWTGLKLDPPHDAGVFYTNPSVQAGSVVLLVAFWQDC